MKRPHISPALVISLVALFVSMSGAAWAATGGDFILGQANSATTQTGLTANFAGKTLQLTNTSTASGATPLGLTPGAGRPPLVTPSSTKVTNLNADKLDGLDSTQLQRRVTGACAADSAVQSVAADGSVSCAAFPHAGITTIGNAIGPFPASDDIGHFTTTGGTLLFSFSASASSATAPNEIGAILVICSSTPCDVGNAVLVADQASFYTTEAHSQRTLVSQWNYVGLQAGTYYVNVSPVAGTTMDSGSEAAWLGLQL